MLKKRVFVYLFKSIAVSLCTLLLCKPLLANASKATLSSEGIRNGSELYLLHCNDCHGRSLTGGVGFNLIDGEWVHGNKPAEIAANIGKGFASKGMPGFSGVLSNEEINNIVDFILSKRVGFENLRYKVWPISAGKKIKIDTLKLGKPLKTGTLHHDNLMDFAFTELKNFAIELEGTLHAPLDQDTMFNARLADETQVRVWINDQLIEKKLFSWLEWAWPLARGAQKVRVRYITSGDAKWLGRDLRFFITDKSVDTKLFPVSIGAKAIIDKQKYTKNVAGSIERKRISPLPAFSINIGVDSETSYAFNTRSCAIVGVWAGKALNIGPNIFNRGNAGSKIEGVWYFKSPHQIGLADSTQCDYLKYRRGEIPAVYFSVDGVEYKLAAKRVGDSLQFDYEQLTGGSNANLDIMMTPEIGAATKVLSSASENHSKQRITIALPKDK